MGKIYQAKINANGSILNIYIRVKCLCAQSHIIDITLYYIVRVFGIRVNRERIENSRVLSREKNLLTDLKANSEKNKTNELLQIYFITDDRHYLYSEILEICLFPVDDHVDNHISISVIQIVVINAVILTLEKITFITCFSFSTAGGVCLIFTNALKR